MSLQKTVENIKQIKMNLSYYPRLSRAYEIALNGKFSIGLSADISEYPSFSEDYPLIIAFYNRVPFSEDPDMCIELYNPQFDNRKSEDMSALLGRTQKYTNISEDLTLSSSGEVLLKNAMQRLNLGLKDRDLILRIARVITNMEGDPLIQVSYLAEAIMYRTYSPKKKYISDISIRLEELSTNQLSQVLTYIKVL